MRVPVPGLASLVHYRGKLGLQAPRAAIVTATTESLDPRGVEAGEVPAISSPLHVHLWVFTPGMQNPQGGFPEFDVPYGSAPGQWQWPPEP